MFSILIRPFLFLFRDAWVAGEGSHMPQRRRGAARLNWVRSEDGRLRSHWQAD